MFRKSEFFSRNREAAACVLALVAISAFLLLRYAPDCGMKYDAGMYAGLAYSLHAKGEYTYNGVKGDLPPMFPLMLSFSLFFGEGAIDYVVPATAILLAVAAFLFFSLFAKPKFAFLGSLLVITNPAVFEYSLGHFRDVPVLFFTFMMYFLYERSIKPENAGNKKALAVLLGIFFAFGFLSTYSMFLYFLPILIHAALNRNSSILLALGAAALLISPWAAWSMINYNTLFVEHSSYLIRYISFGKGLRYFSGFLLPRFIKFSPVLTVLAVFGLLKEILSKEESKQSLIKNMYFQLALFTVLPNSIWPEQEIRYLFPLLIALGYFALACNSTSMKQDASAQQAGALASAKYQRHAAASAQQAGALACNSTSMKQDASAQQAGALAPAIAPASGYTQASQQAGALALVLLAGIVAQGTVALGIADYNCPRFLLLKDAGLWLRKNAEENDTLMAGSFYQISYYSRRITYQIPKDQKKAEELIKGKGVKYVIVDTYEKTTPQYAYTYFEKYELVNKFSHLGEEVKIYRAS